MEDLLDFNPFMPKKRQKKKNKKIKNIGQSDPNRGSHIYEYIPSPFEGMNESQVFERLKTIGEDFGKSFNLSLEELRTKLLTLNPLRLLSLFNFGRIHFDGKDPELTQQNPILQYHVEILQAIALQFRLDKFKFDPVTNVEVGIVHELVKKVAEGFKLRRLTALASSMPEEERERIVALETIRSETQAVRNWGYPQHVSRVVAGLFESLEDRIEQLIGVRVAHLIEMWSRLKSLTEERTKRHINKVRSVVQARTVRAAVQRFYEQFPEPESTREEVLRSFEERNLSLAQVRHILITHSEQEAENIFTFTLEDFLRAYPRAIAPSVMREVLDKWAYSFGDLDQHNSEYFFMANPIWSHPLIHLDEGVYFWPITELFLSFCMELMEALIQEHAELVNKYEKRRGKFLEDETERLFRSAFPSANVYRGSLWRDPGSGKEYENDLLILIDSYLIVVEAKAGKVSDRARRGDHARLKRAIDDLLIAPSRQAKRFTDYLKANPGRQQFQTRRGEVNEVDTSDITAIIRLNVMLESLGALGARWPFLSQAGFIQYKDEMAPAMTIVDLDILFEILSGTCEKLHYLVRRARFETDVDYIGDEMDLIAYYIDTGFNIPEQHFKEAGLLYLYGESKRLDSYFMKEWNKRNVPKPSLHMTKWWRDILQKVEERQPPQWIAIGHMLLNAGHEEQLFFEKGFKQNQNLVRKHKTMTHEIISLRTDPSQRRETIIGLAYKPTTREQCYQWMNQAVAIVTQEEATDLVLVIGVDAIQRNYPYSIIGCLKK